MVGSVGLQMLVNFGGAIKYKQRRRFGDYFRRSSVTSEAAGTGATRQRLLTEARVPGIAILLDRLSVAPHGETRLDASGRRTT